MEELQDIAREEMLIKQIAFAVNCKGCPNPSICQGCECLTLLFNEAKSMSKEDPELKEKIAMTALREVIEKMDMIFDRYNDHSQKTKQFTLAN